MIISKIPTFTTKGYKSKSSQNIQINFDSQEGVRYKVYAVFLRRVLNKGQSEPTGTYRKSAK